MQRMAVVGAVLLTGRGLLLVSKRAAPATFYLPGGKPEPGESDLDCLVREVHEELDVQVTSAKSLLRARTPAALEDAEMDLHVYEATVSGEPRAAAEIADLRWWPECGDVVLAPAIRDVVIPELERLGRLRPAAHVLVRRVPAADTVALRSEVLRPGLPADVVVKETDEDPDTWFFAAVAPGGRVLATVNVRPAAPPWDVHAAGYWQLRGMATAVDARGKGHARAVVDAALEQVDRERVRVWCNARTSVLDFYRRFGFEGVGEVWHDPVSGPHRCLLRAVARR